MEKKKRGCNYKPAEKVKLLELVRKYQRIIESKETSYSMIYTKRKAWEAVHRQYNATAESGFRTLQQLRHLYENLKQRSKKNIANGNNDINRNGGGSIHSAQDAQICYAAIYSDETESDVSDIIIIPDGKLSSSSSSSTIDNQQAAKIKPQEESKPSRSSSAGRLKPTHITTRQQYLRTKLRNAKLETKYLINKNRMEINKYKLEMQFWKLRIEKLKSKKIKI